MLLLTNQKQTIITCVPILYCLSIRCHVIHTPKTQTSRHSYSVSKGISLHKMSSEEAVDVPGLGCQQLLSHMLISISTDA